MNRPVLFALLGACAALATFAAPPSALPLPAPAISLPSPPQLTLPPIPAHLALKSPPPPGVSGGITISSFFICGGGGLFETRRPLNGLIELYGSVENFGIVFGAPKVELITLRQSPAQTVQLSGNDAAFLRALLTQEGTFDWDEPEAYEPEAPDYRLRARFSERGKRIDVDFCFADRMLRVLRNGQPVATMNFAYGQDALVALVDRHLSDVTLR